MASDLFKAQLRLAEDELWLAFEKTAGIRHNLSRGMAREFGVAEFLSERLPSRFGIASGEVVDSGDRHSTQLDLIVYDRQVMAPLIVQGGEVRVLPAESLLAVVEVKSTLTQDELDKSAKAARALARLRPFGKAYVPARLEGAPANDGRSRCMYSVVAFNTNLGREDWASKEWGRLKRATQAAGGAPEQVDRVMVLDRGMLLPTMRKAKTVDPDDGKGMLRDWFIHLSNFVVREAARRPLFDLNRYAHERTNPGWTPLD